MRRVVKVNDETPDEGMTFLSIVFFAALVIGVSAWIALSVLVTFGVLR